MDTGSAKSKRNRAMGRKKKIETTHDSNAAKISIVRDAYSIFGERNFNMCTMGARLWP